MFKANTVKDFLYFVKYLRIRILGTRESGGNQSPRPPNSWEQAGTREEGAGSWTVTGVGGRRAWKGPDKLGETS